MSLIYKFFNAINRVKPAPQVEAHCDIPCGIYDPHHAQLSAHTVVRMVNLIGELKRPGPDTTPEERDTYVHQLARYTAVKEEHAEQCKREVRILWGDYFKPEHVKQYPELHELAFKVMKLGSKARQEINEAAAKELLETVQKIAEIFWKTKDLEPVRVKAPFPSGGEMVLHK